MAAATNPIDAEVWDARAEHDVGLLLRRYLRENPAPSGSLVAPELAATSEDLEKSGASQLSQLGARRLRSAPERPAKKARRKKA
jgi:hypothetical protein